MELIHSETIQHKGIPINIYLFTCEEDIDPADHFEDPRDVEFAREGGSHWFCAKVEARLASDAEHRANWPHWGDDGTPVGVDYLGGCSYSSFEDFYTGERGYYQDMKEAAVGELFEVLKRRVEEADKIRKVLEGRN